MILQVLGFSACFETAALCGNVLGQKTLSHSFHVCSHRRRWKVRIHAQGLCWPNKVRALGTTPQCKVSYLLAFKRRNAALRTHASSGGKAHAMISLKVFEQGAHFGHHSAM